MLKSFGLVLELGFLVFGEMLSVLVLVLDTVPLFLPFVLSESWVIGETVDEEITSSDGIVDGETGGVTDGIGVWRELSALEEEGTGSGEIFDSLNADGDHTGFNFLDIDLASDSDGFESGNVLSTNDMVSGVLGIDTTLVTDEILHGYESLSVGSHDNDLFVSSEGASDSGELGEGAHEDGLVSESSGEILLPHHETTVTGDSADLLLVH